VDRLERRRSIPRRPAIIQTPHHPDSAHQQTPTTRGGVLAGIFAAAEGRAKG